MANSLFNKKNISTRTRIIALESIYNEILKLISICTICTMQNNTSPEHISGSLDMLVEYKLATNFNMVATACEKRKKIQENLFIGIFSCKCIICICKIYKTCCFNLPALPMFFTEGVKFSAYCF